MSKISSCGKFTYGQDELTIHSWDDDIKLSIGNFCSIGGGVHVFLGGNHRIDWITTYPFGHIFESELGGKDIVGHPMSKGNVCIGDDVWIGQGAAIMSGITIESGAVIGANSVVTRDVKPYEIVAGNPAKHIRFRFDEEIVELLLQLKWWELPTDNIKEIMKDLSSPPTVELIKELIKKFR